MILENKNEPKKESTILKRIKTYKQDVADAIHKDNVSIVKMALAENKKREENKEIDEERSPTSRRNIILISISVFLVLIGGGAVGLFYYINQITPKNVTATPVVTDVIHFEYSENIDLTNSNRQDVFNAIQNEKNSNLPLGTIKKLVFVASSSKIQGVMTFNDFMGALNSNIPNELVRSLDPQFFFGLHSFQANNPFIILTTSSYDNAYSGMLDYEPAMENDMEGIFGLTEAQTSSSTATSTKTTLNTRHWADKVIDNKDVRVFIDGGGNSLFFYSFLDQNTIIITDNIDTFTEVVDRLLKNQLVH